jgi:trimeric autotransporter adhesin
MTRVILTTFLLAFTSNAISQDLSVTHEFKEGQTASAAEVNQNFNDLVTYVNAIVSKDTQSNTATGDNALGNNTKGNNNTASGNKALFYNTEGNFNTASGSFFLFSNTEGKDNAASGYQALLSNTTGDNNTASGNQALYSNSTGIQNTASGSGALFSNTTGDENTASGYQVLLNNSTGDMNTAIGDAALIANTTGNYNTAIGFWADVGTGDLENATAIGYNAKVDASNKVRIGNADVTVIEGQVPFSASSDARLKEDITVVDVGLALVNDLNPVSYHRINSSNDDIEMGLLSQEVEETLAAHGLSNSGMVHQASEGAYRSVRYNDLLAPMIKAIQELDDAAEAKDQQIASLEQRLQSQQEELLAVVQSQQKQIAQLQRVVEHQFASR